MFRTLLGLIVSGFRQDPVKAIAANLGVLRTHPVVVFQAVVFLRYPTWTSAALFFLGSFANHLLVNITLQFRNGSTWGALQKEIVEKFRDFTFHSVPTSLYLGEEDYADMEYWLVKKFRGPEATLNDVIRVHVWRKPGTVVANLASYSVPLARSHLFLPDEPGAIRGIRRYQVLHEIGHALTRIMTNSAFVEMGIVPCLFFIAWFAATSEWSVHALAAGLAYVAAVGVWHSDIGEQRQRRKLQAELLADWFAVGYLSVEDCRAAAVNPLLKLLKDADLSELHNTIRLSRLREMLELKAAGHDEEASNLTASEIRQPALGDAVWAVLLVGAMAVYAAVPTGRVVAWSAVLTGFLFLFFLLLIFHALNTHQVLIRHLEARGEPAPA